MLYNAIASSRGNITTIRMYKHSGFVVDLSDRKKGDSSLQRARRYLGVVEIPNIEMSRETTTPTNFRSRGNACHHGEQLGLTHNYHQSSIDLVVAVYRLIALDREIRPQIDLVHLWQRLASERLEYLRVGALSVLFTNRLCRKR